MASLRARQATLRPVTSPEPGDPRQLLRRSLESGRIHSAYLVSGPGSEPREAALAFARGVVCRGEGPRPCEACSDCRRSSPREEIELDGTGRKGPLLRHVGDHPDLLWVERGAGDTRVRIGQVRALQEALRLRTYEGGESRRAAVIADAEWLNAEAQNALLRLLEEPPPRTSLVLVATSSTSLLATVRSRCQKVALRGPDADPLDDPEARELAQRLDDLPARSVPELLDWAEEYRGARVVAAEGVHFLLEIGAAWLRARVAAAVREPGASVRGELDAHRALAECRKHLDQRNANPQMVAERALLTLREVAAR
jgi:DNA polymerase-3 subunit delta'